MMKRVVLLLAAFCAPLACAEEAAVDGATWQYKVQNGDSLWTVSGRHLQSMAYVPKLQALNRVPNPYHLQPGSTLNIPYAWIKQADANATLEEMAGPVSIQGRNGASLNPAVGQQYGSGTRLSTGKDAMLRLRFRDGSALLLNAGTTLTLGNQVFYPSTGSIRSQNQLAAGSTNSSVIPNPLMPSRYQIQTPSAVTSVRGTEFRVRSIADDNTASEVLRGKVNVQSAAHEVYVPAGFGSLSKGDGQPMALPPAPRLKDFAVAAEFNPVRLSWRAEAEEKGYRAEISRLDDGKPLLDRNTDTPSLVLPLAQSGRYQLTIRALNAAGLEGYDSQRSFTIQPLPYPPLWIAAENPRQKNRIFKPGLMVDGAHAARLQISASGDFSQPLFDVKVDSPDWAIALPRAGDWHWRAAMYDADGGNGPFSGEQTLRMEDGVSWLSGQTLYLQIRRYPVSQARYTLQLFKPGQDAPIASLASDRPAWPASKLPAGRFDAKIQIDAEGYRAEETHPGLTLPGSSLF
ncbi:FecR domain-containing protein [Chromobacterium sp. IIBBL 290-4]|uniref:FecR domain-containing protein n=1 Tax=Chromobacterium sp. IIBBL 290-4 TaxID=2953890 RepID=UPI0020B79755|nr:FecR domain-containing protein [Chromobacterium sp. IIBBL 290-4]UTH74406.1 FecR domain-containing protein [Chromobacterium sp. IIBBL 290-4]